MKKLFTLAFVACFSLVATAQNKPAAQSGQTTKLESKQQLKQAQPETKKVSVAKIEQRAANAKRIDAQNTKGTVLTSEQVKVRAQDKAATPKQRVEK